MIDPATRGRLEYIQQTLNEARLITQREGRNLPARVEPYFQAIREALTGAPAWEPRLIESEIKEQLQQFEDELLVLKTCITSGGRGLRSRMYEHFNKLMEMLDTILTAHWFIRTEPYQPPTPPQK